MHKLLAATVDVVPEEALDLGTTATRAKEAQ
jgi:hypothetical protein